MTLNSMLPAGPLVRADRVQVLAVTGTQRIKTLTEVPAIEESGLPQFGDPACSGRLAPVGVPPPVLELQHHDIAATAESSALAHWLLNEGSRLVPTATRAAFRSFVGSEFARWGEILRAAGSRAD